MQIMGVSMGIPFERRGIIGVGKWVGGQKGGKRIWRDQNQDYHVKEVIG